MGSHVRLKRWVAGFALILLVSMVSGCTGGVSGPGPQTLALEARNPVVSDLELTTATRFRYSAGDGGKSLSYAYPSHHHQLFEPKDGFTLEDVATEAVRVATEAGWELEQDVFGDWCGDRPGESGQDVLLIVIRPVPVLPENPPHVIVFLDRGQTGC